MRYFISTLVFALVGVMIPFVAVLCTGNHNKITVYLGFDFWWIYLFNFVGVAVMLAIRLTWLMSGTRGGMVDRLLMICFVLLFASHLLLPLDPLMMFAWVTIPFGVSVIFVIMILFCILARRIRSMIKP